MYKVHGNVEGIKEVVLKELEELYNIKVPKYQIATLELIKKMSNVSTLINREIAVFIDRRGLIVGVSIGDDKTVNLISQTNRRSETSLSGLRCVHTHPKSSGKLSSVDLSALITLKLDAMVAIGVSENKINDAYFALPGLSIENSITYRIYGPYSLDNLLEVEFDSLIMKAEKEFSQRKTSVTVKQEVERAILIAVQSNKASEQVIKASLDELKSLAETAGLQVLHSDFQKREKPDQSTYLGKGKIKELALVVQSLNGNVIICDDELTPSQQRNIEALVGVKVIDRTVLILDIFAQRARSREGKIQVELAQLNYFLPRLVGQGVSMSRLGGGIGTRGPGETKLEVDRRKLRRRISDLERELHKISGQRQLLRKKRLENQVPLIALVGYTNAGKSSLLNALISLSLENKSQDVVIKEVFSADMLFATLDTTYRRLVLEDKSELIMVDTVGFINKLPHHLVKAFRATLEEALEADVLLHVVDGSSKDLDQQMTVALQVIQELGVRDKPIVTAINKIDLCKDNISLPVTSGSEVAVSALTGEGLASLLEKIQDSLPIKKISGTFLFKHHEGKLLNQIHSVGQVLSQEYSIEGTLVTAKLQVEDYYKFMEHAVKEENNCH